jgi:hypothetical protein
MFVGYSDNEKCPVTGFTESTEVLTLLKISPDQQKKLPEFAEKNTPLTAQEDFGLKVVQKNFEKGRIRVPLQMTPTMKIMVWFGMDFGKVTLTCGGNEEEMTGPMSRIYSGCKSSSNKEEGFSCEAGLSNEWADEEAKIWKSDQEGVGGWLSIDFKVKFRPTEIWVKQLDDPMQMNKKLKIY